MLVAEAKWLGRRIAALNPDEVFPLLNVGSSTEAFRTKDQPFVEAILFRPLREQGRAVVHCDLKPAPGVDVVGDILDPTVQRNLAGRGFRSVLCSNVLEHVRDARAFCRAVVSLVPDGGYVFVSCPYRYPFHPDPIDTMLRPDTDELAGLFDTTHVVAAEVLYGGRYLRWRADQPASILRNVLILAMPFYKPRRWIWSFRKIYATCAVLRRIAAGPRDAPGKSLHLAKGLP